VGQINAGLLGQTVEVLVEERHRGKWRGRTRTNKLVFFDVDGADWTGALVEVRITQTGPWSMQAEVASPADGQPKIPGADR
jgi:tRNA-2-methylthio-N6-dimethylallyladenosine synthase